jgi:hypothetical protein
MTPPRRSNQQPVAGLPFMAESFGNSFTVMDVNAEALSADGHKADLDWGAKPSQALTWYSQPLRRLDGGTRGSTLTKSCTRAAKAFPGVKPQAGRCLSRAYSQARLHPERGSLVPGRSFNEHRKTSSG